MTDLALAALTTAFLVFATSASAKLRSRNSYSEYRSDLDGTRLVPPAVLPAIAVALLAWETLTAIGAGTASVLLIADPPQATAVSVGVLCVAIALTAVLAAGIGAILRRGTTAQCACFGSSSQRALGLPHLARNLGLLALLVAAIFCVSGRYGQPPVGGAALAIFTGVVIGLLFVRFDDLWELFRPLPTGIGP